MKLYLSPKAQYQYQCLKGRSVPYAEQVKTLLDASEGHSGASALRSGIARPGGALLPGLLGTPL